MGQAQVVPPVYGLIHYENSGLMQKIREVVNPCYVMTSPGILAQVLRRSDQPEDTSAQGKAIVQVHLSA